MAGFLYFNSAQLKNGSLAEFHKNKKNKKINKIC